MDCILIYSLPPAASICLHFKFILIQHTTMKGVSKMYFIQCEKYDCRTNSVVTRIFCDIDQEDVDPIELDFSNNHIGDAGVRAILGTVHTIRRLQRLNLG